MTLASGLLLAAITIAGIVAYVLYIELRNQHHIWHASCVTPEETRDDIVHVLKIFRKVLDGKGITWWLDYGTLLGAWRVNGPMAFDHDLDISFLGNHEPLLRACKDEFASHGVELNMERTSIFYKGQKLGDMEPWWQHGTRLCRDDPKRREGVMRFWRPLVDDFPAAWVDPPWRIDFVGKTYPCPNKPERFLRKRYLTCRLNLRLVIPHKQKCWFCETFWREAARIWGFRSKPAAPGMAENSA